MPSQFLSHGPWPRFRLAYVLDMKPYALFCTVGMSRDLRAYEDPSGLSRGLLDEPRHRAAQKLPPAPATLAGASKDRCAASLMSGEQVETNVLKAESDGSERSAKFQSLSLVETNLTGFLGQEVVFVLIFTLLRDEALASEPEPEDFATLIHQQQQTHERVRAARESNLQFEHRKSLDDHFRPKKLNCLKCLALNLLFRGIRAPIPSSTMLDPNQSLNLFGWALSFGQCQTGGGSHLSSIPELFAQIMAVPRDQLSAG
ncbi:hypothetical protein TURU_140442 [Turdus rufiventris]|nr:hypothetical protein TURU_140442 [Turdus rufiventris]